MSEVVRKGRYGFVKTEKVLGEGPVPSRAGRGWVAGALVALAGAVFLSFSSPARAVVTFDLLHDTNETRKMIKEELGKTSLPSSVGTGDAEKPVARGELETIWFAREKFLQIGEREKARNQLNTLWEKQMERGVRNLPEYGDVLVREALRNIDVGKLDHANEVLSMARRIYPEGLPVYVAAAALALKKSIANVNGAGLELIAAYKTIIRSFRLQSWIVINSIIVLFVSLCIFFSAAIAAMVIGHARRIAHDLSEMLPHRFSSGTRAVLGWLLLFLPLLIQLPAWWWFILGGMLVIPYVNNVGRAIVALGAVFMLFLPWQVGFASSLFSMQRQPLLERVVSVREGHWTDEDYWALKGLVEKNPTNGMAAFTLGLVAKRMGNFEEAGQAYEKALALLPRNAAAWNNRGNLALIEKQVDQAIANYQKAIEIDPELFAPHYNLSLAYREKFLFPEGEKESLRAVSIDPDANAYYTRISSTHFNRYTVDELPQLKSIWKLAVTENKWQVATADHLWLALMIVPTRQSWPFTMGGIFLLTAGLWLFRRSRGLAVNCHKCGRVFCNRCRSGRNATLCSQCHHIFVRKEGVEARVRVRKMADIKRNQQLGSGRRIIFAALIPGGGHMTVGRYGTGMLFLLPAAFLLARILAGSRLFPAVWHLQVAGGTLVTLPFVLVLVLVWVLSFTQALRLEE